MGRVKGRGAGEGNREKGEGNKHLRWSCPCHQEAVRLRRGAEGKKGRREERRGEGR